MKLGQRMLLVFAATVFAGMVALYFLSRVLLLSNFRQLEAEQTKQTVEFAVTALYESYHSLGTVASDYAYWDRTYDFMANPIKNDISREFQNGGMEGLGINLIVIRDLTGKTVFAKAYDTQTQCTDTSSRTVPGCHLCKARNATCNRGVHAFGRHRGIPRWPLPHFQSPHPHLRAWWRLTRSSPAGTWFRRRSKNPAQ